MKNTNTTDAAVVADNVRELTMEALMQQFEMPTAPKRNTIVDGEVVGSVKGGFLVSLGLKADILVKDAEPGELEVGKTYPFFVIDEDVDGEGGIALSLKHARIWTRMAKLVESRDTVTAKVHPDPKRGIARSNKTDRVGGVIAYLDGVRCFIPRSELRHVGRLEDLCGKELKVKVISADPSRGRIGEVILSQTRALRELRLARLAQLKVGDIVPGKIIRIIEAGLLVDLGGDLSGLVYRTEVGGARNSKPSNHVKVNDDVNVKVLAVNAEKGQISLSLRAARQTEFFATLEVGQKITGRVARFESYGAFIQLGGCVDGLLHVSNFCMEGGQRETLTKGAEIEVVIRRLDAATGRIGLTRKAGDSGSAISLAK